MRLITANSRLRKLLREEEYVLWGVPGVPGSEDDIVDRPPGVFGDQCDSGVTGPLYALA